MRPSIRDIDWTAPAVDLADELIERWFEANEESDLDIEDKILMSEEWADRMIAAHAE